MVRKIAAVLLACLVLAGCGKDRYEGDLKFKITKKNANSFEVDSAQELPPAALSDRIVGLVVNKSHFPDGAAVGDEFTCHLVEQEMESKGFGRDTAVTDCRKG